MSRSLFALGAAAVLAGCPGSLDDPARFGLDADGGGAGGTGGSTACPDIPAFFTTTCALAGCHATASSAGGLDLGSPDIFERLSGKAATQDGLLIDTSAPAKSVLYLKLLAPPPYGSRMPLGGTPLDATTAGCVLTWIESGGGDGGAP